MAHFIDLEGCKIKVSFKKRIVCITNDNELSKLLSHRIEERTTKLVKAIKKEYAALKGTELKIPDDSMIVEIWGHIYFERFALAINRFIKLKPVALFAKIAIKRCEIIDCGELSLDHNRFFWNALVPFKNLIAKLFLRKKDKRSKKQQRP